VVEERKEETSLFREKVPTFALSLPGKKYLVVKRKKQDRDTTSKSSLLSREEVSISRPGRATLHKKDKGDEATARRVQDALGDTTTRRCEQRREKRRKKSEI